MKKVLAVILAATMACTLLASCATSAPSSDTTPASTEISAAASAAETAGLTGEPVKLTYFIQLGDKASQVIKSNAEIPVYDVLTEMTGVSIDWNHPSASTPDDVMTQLNLLIASNDLPDMVFVDWNSYSGGMAKAIGDGVIIKLNDYIDKSTPNYAKLLGENPDLKKQVSLDDGTIAVFPSARTDMSVRVWFGPQIRKDWLKNADMNEPVTINDWYNVLKAFKEKDVNGNGDPNDEIPFVAAGLGYFYNFTGAFGYVRDTFSLKNGKVIYGPADAGYKDYLETMARWYDEGLIDPDWAATDGNSVKSMVTSNQAGAYFGSLAGNLGGYSNALKDAYPNGELMGTAWPSGADGKAYQTEGQHIKAFNGAGTAITTACKNVDAALKWLDAHYSEEGHMLMNFGIEGGSYKMVDNYPTFTDAVFKDPTGLSYDIALAKYSLAANTAEVMVQDPREFAQFSLATDYQKEANKKWGAGDTSLLLPNTSMTTKESEEYSKIMSDIKTYTGEMIVKFVMGQEPIGNFDKFVGNLKSMGIERATEIQQAAYDRYLAR